MKILVTGASGLLGTCLMDILGEDAPCEGTCHENPAPNLLPLDVTNPDAVRARLVKGRYTHVIHSAAERDPDRCLRDPAHAYRLNALGSELVAQACRETGTRLVYISTDYVFDGQTPPYPEDAPPCPVNVYGRTKLAGEMAARSVPGSLVVRIPALYTLHLDDPRNVLHKFAALLRGGGVHPQDAETVRYYTRADDVARGVRFALKHDIQGILHLTADQKTSKADFVQRLAQALGEDPARVPDGPAPTTGDVRPPNSRLDNTQYKQLGGPAFDSIDASFAKLHPMD